MSLNDPANKPSDPQPSKRPVQIYPDPSAPQNHSATSTDIRLLREDVLNELDHEEPPTVILPPASRVAIWVLAASSLVLCVLLWQYVLIARPWDKNQAQTPAVETPAVTPALPTPPVETEQPKPPVIVNNVPPPDDLQPVPPDPAAAQLAELDLLAEMLSNGVKYDRAAMLARLKPYTESVLQKVRQRAGDIITPLMADIDAQARDAARHAAETVNEKLAAKDYLKALAAVDAALQYLPPESQWGAAIGMKQLKDLRDQVAKERENEQIHALKEFKQRLEKDVKTATTDPILQHPDPQLRQAAEILRLEFVDESTRKKLQEQKLVSESRAVWLEFFQQYSAAVMEADYALAGKLATKIGEHPTAGPAVPDPIRVAQGFTLEVDAIQRLYDAALDKAKTLKRSVDFTPRGRRVQGSLEGVEGRNLRIAIRGGALVTVRIDGLKPQDISLFLNDEDLKSLKLQPAFWALKLNENPANATWVAEQYKAATLELPLHIGERIRLERFKLLDQDVGGKIFALSQSLDTAGADFIKNALKEIDALLPEFEAFEPLSDARKVVLERARKLIAKAVRQKIVLQNGIAPNPDYAGISTDQISDYRESQKKTDVSVRNGMRVGRDGGLHRLLLRIDGLDVYVGKGKVKKATLELHQIKSPEANGAVVSLFRLKRAWVPNQGTWLCYDQSKESKWAFPGAVGGEDIITTQDTQCFMDKLDGTWRAWDITRYVQEVISGQHQNNGLLLRVTNGEPNFHVRFYPETDLEPARKDANLRPRVVIDLEDTGE